MNTPKPYFALPPMVPNLRRCVVIGAGIAGCSLAYTLSQRGLDVVVVDKKGITQGASGNHVGVLQPSPSLGFSPPSELATLGYFFTKNLIRELTAQGHDIPHDFSGSFRVLKTQTEALRAKKLIQTLASNKKRSHILIQQEKIEEECGFSADYQGIFAREGGWVHPPALCRALLNASGASLCIPASFASLHFDGSMWHILDKTGRTITRAEAVFFAHAHGAQKDSFLQSIPLFKIRGQVSLIESTCDSRKIKTILSGAGYLTPSFNNFHILGATYQRGDSHADLRYADQTELFDHFASAYPKISIQLGLSQRPLIGRVSWRCSSENRLPLVGGVPNFSDGSFYRTCTREMLRRGSSIIPASSLYIRGQYMSIAHGSRGLTIAPLAAELLARAATGEKLSIDSRIWEALHPARYIVRERKKGHVV